MANTIETIKQNTMAKIALELVEENENSCMEDITEMIEMLMNGNGVDWKSMDNAIDAATFRADVIGDGWALFELNKEGVTVKEAFAGYINTEALDIYRMTAALLVFTNMNEIYK
jgi:hypothetical protein